MPYQSNSSGRQVQESYDDSSFAPASSGGSLLPNSNNINVGSSNSARGGGTTTAELVAKFRFLNCAVCLFILLFHTLPILLNPVRLTLLATSPTRLILECIVGILSLCLLLIEARIPFLGEKALYLVRGIGVDLDVARGRVLALVMMSGSMLLTKYLWYKGEGVSASNASDDTSTIPVANNVTDSGDVDTSGAAGDNVTGSAILVILQCIIFSPSILIVFVLFVYTLFTMHNFPEYASAREYPDPDGDHHTPRTSGNSGGPAWVSDVGDFARPEGSGYQTVGAA